MRTKSLSIGVLAALAAAPLHAELKFTTRLQMRDATVAAPAADPVTAMLAGRLAESLLPGGSLETTITIGDKGVRVEWNKPLPNTPEGAVLLGRPDGSVAMLNPSAKTYWKMSADAVRKEMSGPMPVVTTHRTGKFEDVAGVRCEMVTYEMRVPLPAPSGAAPPGMPTELAMTGESCVAERYKSYGLLMAKVPGLAVLGGEKLAEDGLPLRQITRSAAFNGKEMESVVLRIAEEKAPAGTFDIPAGFKEVPPPGGGR